MTVTEALELRKKLVAAEGKSSITAGVVGQVLRGLYDKCDDPAKDAQGDIDFLKVEQVAWAKTKAAVK